MLVDFRISNHGTGCDEMVFGRDGRDFAMFSTFVITPEKSVITTPPGFRRPIGRYPVARKGADVRPPCKTLHAEAIQAQIVRARGPERVAGMSLLMRHLALLGMLAIVSLVVVLSDRQAQLIGDRLQVVLPLAGLACAIAQGNGVRDTGAIPAARSGDKGAEIRPWRCADQPAAEWRRAWIPVGPHRGDEFRRDRPGHGLPA
ncbi:hypothetical protein [Rhodovulum sp.]|uniref:hypothetical protein n=1 Tax=Rhodovulum sp. TaxID=34009 RepID=UPI00257DD36B|nr:hypothetical protein [Rhodovulum sp.]